ncbi:hypothetical protein GUJ93_ZPchr0001g31675 [Zizania palustris]|uniref:Uncharacterized protein n=1 Tax=Zizania palustris TaxID=103762 RepID=A0A8J5RSJ3_ZIZPA|nr:hypothetical protein GUJ93_ZPchr0001g31675 [Zizania palustris]
MHPQAGCCCRRLAAPIAERHHPAPLPRAAERCCPRAAPHRCSRVPRRRSHAPRHRSSVSPCRASSSAVTSS